MATHTTAPKTRYDHFHATFITGTPCEACAVITGPGCQFCHDTRLEARSIMETEIEGGFTGYPNGWEKFDMVERAQWLRDLALAWGMPPEARLLGVRLAG